MKKIILALIIFLSASSSVSALEISDWYYPSTIGTSHQDWSTSTNVSLLQADDGNEYANNCLPSNNCIQSLKFDFSDIEDSIGIVKNIEVEVETRRWYNITYGVTPQLQFYPNYQDQNYLTGNLTSATQQYSYTYINQTDQVVSFFWSDNEPTHNDVSDYFSTYGWNGSDFTLNMLHYIGGGTSSSIVDVDYLKIRLWYELAGSSSGIDDYTASPSAQLVSLDLSGDTSTSSASIYCTIEVFEECSGTGVAGWTSEIPVAYIDLDPNNDATYTQQTSPDRYLGYGYSASSSQWSAENVSVPYNPGVSCQYPMHTVCTERILDCSSGTNCVWVDTIIHEDSWTNDGTIIDHTQTFTEPEPDNPLAWVVWKIKQTLFDLFVPNFALSHQEYLSLSNSLRERAPFAYIFPVFEMDWTDPGGSEVMPTISFPTSYAMGSDIDWDAPPWLYDVISAFKGFFVVVVWLGFVVYVFNLAKRILPQ